MKFSKRYGLLLLEDNSHGHGGTYLGKKLGKKMKIAAKIISNLSQGDIRKIQNREGISLSIEGNVIEFTPGKPQTVWWDKSFTKHSKYI